MGVAVLNDKKIRIDTASRSKEDDAPVNYGSVTYSSLKPRRAHRTFGSAESAFALLLARAAKRSFAKTVKLKLQNVLMYHVSQLPDSDAESR